MSGRVWSLGRVATALLRHPSLWGTALGQLRRMTPPRWWRRAPFLPVPDAAYVRFRLHTMYGDGAHPLEPDDLVAYLRWCRAFPRRAHSCRQAHSSRQAQNAGPGPAAGK